MTCQEFVDFLMQYLDAELDAGQRETFEAHMGDCPPCVTYLETYRQTVQLGKALCTSDGALPEHVPEKLVDAILAARKSTPQT